MAGSYRHITNTDASYRGIELIENLRDAQEALEECYDMINFLSNGIKRRIYKAWVKGHAEKNGLKHYPKTAKEFWR